jgi:hypothetical protein
MWHLPVAIVGLSMGRNIFVPNSRLFLGVNELQAGSFSGDLVGRNFHPDGTNISRRMDSPTIATGKCHIC